MPVKALADVHFPTHVKINIRPVSKIKQEAGACHASQGGIQMRRGLMGFIAKLFGEQENFMRAHPPVNGKTKISRDLFEGIA